MTSRQRVLAAIAHKEPDRVPIDQGAMRSTGIMAIAYNRLKAHLGVTGPPTLLYDLVQQLAQPDDWFLERFHVDAIDWGRAFPVEWQPWTLPDGSPALAPARFRPEWRDGEILMRNEQGLLLGRMPRGALFIDQCYWPLDRPDGLDNFEPLAEQGELSVWGALPTQPADRPVEEMARVARHLYETTDKAIVVGMGGNLFEHGQMLFGMQNLYLHLGSEPAKMHRFLDRVAELHLETLKRILPAVRGYIQVIVMGDDLGSQTGPQISRKMYREFFLPRHKQIYSCARRESGGAHIFLHCCGGIYPLIPDLIEAGVEILNPVQTGARNMEPERLKAEFGRELTFWGGGCDTQGILFRGTPQQVREDVRRRMEVFMEGGGFVWNQIHNVMADVPPANIEAMLDAAYEFGRY